MGSLDPPPICFVNSSLPGNRETTVRVAGTSNATAHITNINFHDEIIDLHTEIHTNLANTYLHPTHTPTSTKTGEHLHLYQKHAHSNWCVYFGHSKYRISIKK